MLYTAVIVEPRKHKALPYVLENFLNNLSDDWSFIIFHGNLNLEFITKIINVELSNHRHRISLKKVNIDNLTTNEYSNLLKYNKDFYNCIPTEIFLIFQTDSIIFEKNKNIINYFLHYDYVGAPWSRAPYNKNECVGNGGLSIRKKSKMLEIMDKQGKNEYPEDVYFSCYESILIHKPSSNDASFFSIEEVFSEVSFGCHKPWCVCDSNQPWSLYDNQILLYNTFEEVKQLYKYNDIPPPVMQSQSAPQPASSPTKKTKQKYNRNFSSLIFQQ